MRKKITILLSVAALVAALVTVAVMLRRYSQTSEVYRRYAQRDDLKVGFVKDYRINDTLAVDVTTITAPDSASWEALLREMNINEVTIAIQRKAMQKGNSVITTYHSLKNNPDKKLKKANQEELDLVVFSYQDRTIFIFDVASLEQAHIIAKQKRKDSIMTEKQANTLALQ